MSFRGVKPVTISGKEMPPIIEGGKGVSVTKGESSGAFAAAGGVGTFSGVNADSYDETGEVIPQTYAGKTRRERHEELVAYAIRGGIQQAQRAYEASNGEGRIHMNVLWEMAATERVLQGVLDGAKGCIHGITCGAGMPFRLAQIAAEHGVYYYPIVSSARAFRALWKRAYRKFPELLGGVVYEDPWLAGGHNGLSNADDPRAPAPPYPRVRQLRQEMNAVGLTDTPIIMAGGVWWLKEWEDWFDDPEVAPMAFQFGTRPLLTQESPISDAWKQQLLNLRKGDVTLHRYSPTGFYSSAIHNEFLQELEARSSRQVPYTTKPVGEHSEAFPTGPRGRPVYLTAGDKERAESWVAAGYTQTMKTPDSTIIFVTPERQRKIQKDQIECMGCLSACVFSNWADNEAGTTGQKADPRSFCIQKTLQDVAHGGSIDNNLVFAGHNAYRFSEDPFYAGGFIPTVKQLVDRIMTGY